MLQHARKLSLAVAILGASTLLFGQGYSLTVNRDRLINAQNEPQNWLLMNGDYGSTRHLKLPQLHRETGKNPPPGRARALGRGHGAGQDGRVAEGNPPSLNRFMYTTHP